MTPSCIRAEHNRVTTVPEPSSAQMRPSESPRVLNTTRMESALAVKYGAQAVRFQPWRCVRSLVLVFILFLYSASLLLQTSCQVPLLCGDM